MGSRGSSRWRDAGEPMGERFALFAECVLLGLLVVLASLPVVTWFAAFVGASRSLDRYLQGGAGVGLRPFLRDARSTLPGTVYAGLAGLGVLAFLALDVAVARAGVPGGSAVVAALVVAMAATLVALLRAAATWDPGRPWAAQLAEGARRTVGDPAGSALLAGGLLVVAVTTWQLPPLLVPAVGCLPMAATAVERRPRGGLTVRSCHP